MTAEDMLADAKRRRRAAVAEAISAGIAVNVAIVVFFAIAAGRVGFSWLWGFIVGIAAFNYRYRRRGSLLWLRRFRPSYAERMRFHSALARACEGLLIPVTVQDASFSASMLGAMQRRWVPLLFVGAGFLFGLVLVAPLATVTDSVAALIVVLLAWAVVYGWLVVVLLRRAGFTELAGDAGRARARRSLEDAAAGHRAPGQGLEVLKCEDAIWRDVVAYGLRTATVVLIDLSEPTESLAHEVTLARRAVDDARLLIAIDDDTDPRGATARLNELLAPDPPVTSEWVEARLVRYPSRLASMSGRKRQYDDLTRALRERIAATLAAPLARQATSERTASNA